MRETPPLPLVHHLSSITDVSCTQAFRAAVSQIRPLRRFSAAAEQLGERLTRELVLHIEEISERRHEEIASRDVCFVPFAGTEAVYTVARQGDLQTGKLTTDVHGFEIIASHIAWDLGLPHVPYGILNMPDGTALASPHPWSRSRSLALLWTKESMDQVAKKHTTAAQSFYALGVFDQWVKGTDRSYNNILFQDALQHNGAIAGIDLEGSLTERFNDRLHPAQAIFLKAHNPDRATLQAARHTLAAIMDYPSERIEAIARRAQLVCREPVAEQAITMLEQRRQSLRADFARYIPQCHWQAILKA